MIRSPRLAAALLDVARERAPDFTEPDDEGHLRPLAESGNLSIQVGDVIDCNEAGKVLKIAEQCWARPSLGARGGAADRARGWTGSEVRRSAAAGQAGAELVTGADSITGLIRRRQAELNERVEWLQSALSSTARSAAS